MDPFNIKTKDVIGLVMVFIGIVGLSFLILSTIHIRNLEAKVKKVQAPVACIPVPHTGAKDFPQ